MNSSALTTSCIKYLLFIFNFMFVISGIIVLTVGVGVQSTYSDWERFLGHSFISTPALLIGVGAIIFFIALFGCCGAVRENYCMIVTFSALLIIVFVLELAAGISGYVLRNRTADVVSTQLHSTMADYNNTDSRDITKLWDNLQTTFGCCGVDTPNDWITHFGALPMSCCERVVGEFNSSTCTLNDKNSLYAEGCLYAFGQFIRNHAVTLGGVGLAIAIIQLMGIIFACHLSRQIKKSYETM